MLNLMLHRLQPFHGAVNFILAQLYVGVYTLAQDTLQVLREQVHAAIEQHANAPLVPLIIRTLLRTAYEQRDLLLLLSAGESHLLAHPHLLAGQKGLAEHFISALRAAAETGLLASYDPVLLAH